MHVKFDVSEIADKFGLGDGEWGEVGMYARLAVIIGRRILKKNPLGTFSIVQMETIHNPIRLHLPDGGSPLNLSGEMTLDLTAVKCLVWSSPSLIEYSLHDGEGGVGQDWDYSHFEGRLFEAIRGKITYRRDRENRPLYGSPKWMRDDGTIIA